MKLLSRLLITALLVAAPMLAGAATWQIDSDHAFIEFKVRHLMVSSVKGVFTKLDGTLEADDADLTKARLNVTIDTASIDTNIAKRDEHLRGQHRYIEHKRFNESFLINASTSPFYPLFASLDVNAKMHAGRAGEQLARLVAQLAPRKLKRDGHRR